MNLTHRIGIVGRIATAIAFVATPSSAQSYTKLAPTDPLVHLANGHGTEMIYFSKLEKTPLPVKTTVTDATGKLNSLPAKDITVGNPVTISANVFSISVSVATSLPVDPGTPYNGTLFLFEAAEAASPYTVKFKIQDDAVVTFESPQTNLTAAVGGSLNPRQRIHVRNSGKATITAFQITSSVLADTASHRTLQMPLHQQTVSLSPGEAMDLDFDLPEPLYAGTYTGTLLVSANHVYEKPISLTVLSRGPFSKWQIPFVLFVFVILIGFSVSAALDAWFGSGGLARAQAYLSLKNSEKEFTQQIDNLSQWKVSLPSLTPPIDVPQAEVWILQALHELRARWQAYADYPTEDVTSLAQSFSARATASSLLWSALQTATGQWHNQPEALREVCASLDNVPIPASPADVARYRLALIGVLTSKAKSAVAQGGEVPTDTTPSRTTTLEFLRAKIRGMTALYQVIVWTVVFTTGYQFFYASHFAFGSLSDYLAVFLWAIGLTSTGAQIVARVHKP